VPAAYVPIDISREPLREAAAQLARDFPLVPVVAVCADYTRPFPLPPLPGPPGKRVGFFPGSTIGNFEPDGVVRFLRHCGELLGRGCEMLIGADLKKAPERLNAAYNDRTGTNAAFNLNLLVRINRELDGDIAVDRFAHVAFYNEAAGRMELYLKSLAAQTVTVAGRRFAFGEGELVHTENSYKYAIDEFGSLAARAGFAVAHSWTDSDALFSVHYLRQQ
jgi:L-histidine N-alpha-methyltransferase